MTRFLIVWVYYAEHDITALLKEGTKKSYMTLTISGWKR